MDKRKIGLKWCEEVSEALRVLFHHTVDGPFSKVIFHKGRMMKVHHDIFGVYDLISSVLGLSILHQVTSSNMKSRKIKNIIKADVSGLGWIWCRTDNRELPEFIIYSFLPVIENKTWRKGKVWKDKSGWHKDF